MTISWSGAKDKVLGLAGDTAGLAVEQYLLDKQAKRDASIAAAGVPQQTAPVEVTGSIVDHSPAKKVAKTWVNYAPVVGATLTAIVAIITIVKVVK